MSAHSVLFVLRLPAVLAAATLPALLAYNVAPSPTFLNQALALALWGAFVALSMAVERSGASARHAWPLLAALGLVALGVAWSWGPGNLPSSLALSALGLLVAAAILAAAGAAQRGGALAVPVFAMFCWSWVLAGVLCSAIAIVQVFMPQWADGDWIARSGLPGRAVGNLRQPNHLSSLLLWATIGVVALIGLRRLALRWALPLFGLMVFAVVLTASRTGLVGVMLLALWGLVDRRSSRAARALMLGAPVMYGSAWLAMAAWAQASAHTFGGAARLAEADLSSSRFGIWANTLALIRAQPWGGVGFGEFNLAWTLTPFPGRPTAFFDHTHNLPLQLAVELGLPLAALVLGLLGWALWQGLLRAAGAQGDIGTAQRAALAMVLMIGLHSLLEYPLWYAYFLLPAAWAWGFAIGDASTPVRRRPLEALIVAGCLLGLGSLAAVVDYARVVAIFSASPGAKPLEQRISEGQASVLFSHHADYAAATTDLGRSSSLGPFEGAVHYLLDTRLMMAWARALAAAGRVEEARQVAARLREFGKPQSDDFFDACELPSSSPPFQCISAAVPRTDWRRFVER